jgi:hypothetical protein
MTMNRGSMRRQIERPPMKKPTKYMRGGMANAAMTRQRKMPEPGPTPQPGSRRPVGMKKGGKVDGAAMRGKTKGRKC